MSEFFLTRHSKSNYNEYDKTLQGENPKGAFDHSKQESSDLSEAGLILAREKAKDFFDKLRPETDRVFFVTSNEARAIGTANVYRLEAKSRGFEIIKPEHTRSNLAKKEGEGELRAIETLSLNTKNTLQFLVFSSSEPSVNWANVDDDFKQKWQEARKIIEADNKGSWGSNFAAHSTKIKSIFPDVETAEQFYNTKFKNILRLIKWANKKIQGAEGKKIKVLGFGHEDYLVKFLQEEFLQEGIQNCETIQFNIDDNANMQAEARGQTKDVKI